MRSFVAGSFVPLIRLWCVVYSRFPEYFHRVEDATLVLELQTTPDAPATVVYDLLEATDASYGNVVLMSETTRLNILADRLAVPPWVPLSGAFSAGDVVLTVSAAWLVQRLMVASARAE